MGRDRSLDSLGERAKALGERYRKAREECERYDSERGGNMGRQTKLDLALLLDECCADFHVGFTPDEALLFAAQVRNYNECNSERMFALIERINEIIPPMKYPDDNPNNGKPHHEFQIGQVPGGRILGVKFCRLDLENHGYTWGDCLALGDRLMELGEEFRAGDVTKREWPEGFALRIGYWWD